MAARKVTITLVGDNKGLDEALAESGGLAEETGKRIGDSMEGATNRAGGALQKLSTKLGAFGLPFSESLGKVGEKLSDAETHGQKLTSAMSALGGATLLGVGGAVAAVGVEAVHLGENFQKSVAQIASSANIPIAAAKKIGTAFLSTAGTTKFTATEMAQAYAPVAGQLGEVEGHALNASQALGVMKESSDLAEASGSSLTSSTAALASTMQTYGMKSADAGKASAVLYNAGRLTGQSVTSVAQSTSKVKQSLGALAPTLAQTGGLMVDLAQHGEGGRKAVSALTTSFTAFLKPVATATKDQVAMQTALSNLTPRLQALAKKYEAGTLTAKQLQTATTNLSTTQTALWDKFQSAAEAAQLSNQAQENMGITATTTTGKLRTLATIIGQLHTQIKGMSTAQAVAKLSADGFGSSASKLVGVIQAGPAAFDKASTAVANHKAMSKAAADQEGTLKDQLETLKATAEDYGTRLGDFLIPKVELLAHDTAHVVTWFEKHKKVAEALAGTIGGVLTAAVAIYTEQKLVKLASGLKGIVTDATKAAKALGGLFTKGGKATVGSNESTATGGGAGAGSKVAGPSSTGSNLTTASEGLQTAAEQLQSAATALSGSATDQDAAATGLDSSATDLSASGTALDTSATGLDASSTNLDASSTDLDASSTALDTSSTDLDASAAAGGLKAGAGAGAIGAAAAGFTGYQLGNAFVKTKAGKGLVHDLSGGLLDLFTHKQTTINAEHPATGKNIRTISAAGDTGITELETQIKSALTNTKQGFIEHIDKVPQTLATDLPVAFQRALQSLNKGNLGVGTQIIQHMTVHLHGVQTVNQMLKQLKQKTQVSSMAGGSTRSGSQGVLP